MISNVIRGFLDALRIQIEMADVHTALGLARLYGNVAWNNPIGVYEARHIEDAIYKKLGDVKGDVIASRRPVGNVSVLHVLTEGYSSGGHTRVVERLIASSDAGNLQDVVIVELCPEAVIKKLENAGASVKHVIDTGAKAVAGLATIMMQYESVILHIHPDDIVSSMAARIARSTGTNVAFYNHADHCFTFGIESSDVLCEIGGYGRMISERYRAETSWTFAGIPLSITPNLPSPRIVKDYVLSSGPAYKFDFNEGGIFSLIVEGILQETILKVMIIGPENLPSGACKKLIKFVSEGRLIVTPAMSHESYLEHLYSCICYLDSAPVTGGSALPEAALLGIPCAGLTNPVMGYSPIDFIRSNSVRNLVKRIKAIAERPESFEEIGREKLVEAHSPTEVLKRILTYFETSKVVDVPATMRAKDVDINYIQEQWARKSAINIQTRAFDYIAASKRVGVAALMNKQKIFNSMRTVDALKMLLSNFKTRKLRNRGSK